LGRGLVGSVGKRQSWGIEKGSEARQVRRVLKASDGDQGVFGEYVPIDEIPKQVAGARVVNATLRKCSRRTQPGGEPSGSICATGCVFGGPRER